METRSFEEQPLALPWNERIRLAEALWQRIDEGLDPDSERQAIELTMPRDQEMESGAVVGRSHEHVMRAVRKAIACG